MLQRIFRTYIAVSRINGSWLAPLFGVVMTLFWASVIIVAQRLDLLSRRVRRCRVTQPIVVAGNPRSGTTFLHRYLDAQGVGTGLRPWDCYCPSVTMQRVLGPLLPRLERLAPVDDLKHAHKFGMTLADTDEIALVVRFCDGPLYYYGPVGTLPESQWGGADRLVPDYAWLRVVWRRVMAIRDCTRIVACLHWLGFHMPAFLAVMPDAKVIYLVRDPREAIPSALNFMVMACEKVYPRLAQLPIEVRQRYFSNIYRGLIDCHKAFVKDWLSGAIDRERVMILPYDRMMQDFAGVMNEILNFVGHAPEESLLQDIAATASRQRSYVSDHVYDPAKFGLDPARIRQDCQFLYDAFLPHLANPGSRADAVDHTIAQAYPSV